MLRHDVRENSMYTCWNFQEFLYLEKSSPLIILAGPKGGVKLLFCAMFIPILLCHQCMLNTHSVNRQGTSSCVEIEQVFLSSISVYFHTYVHILSDMYHVKLVIILLLKYFLLWLWNQKKWTIKLIGCNLYSKSKDMYTFYVLVYFVFRI